MDIFNLIKIKISLSFKYYIKYIFPKLKLIIYLFYLFIKICNKYNLMLIINYLKRIIYIQIIKLYFLLSIKNLSFFDSQGPQKEFLSL